MKMNHYHLYIKSHGEGSDYEDECITTNKFRAAMIFLNRLPESEAKYQWSFRELLDRVLEVKDSQNQR